MREALRRHPRAHAPRCRRPTSAARVAPRVTPTFKFCPECGAPRARVVEDVRGPGVSPTLPDVLPLPFTGRKLRARDAARAHAACARAPDGGHARSMGHEGAGRSDAAAPRVRASSAADGRVIYQVGPDPSGLARAVLSDPLAARRHAAAAAGVERARAARSGARASASTSATCRASPSCSVIRRRCSSSSRRCAAARWCGRRCARSSAPPCTTR